MPRIYTKTGDDGTTGMLFGGRAAKDDVLYDTVGAADEAVAVLGQARSLAPDAELARVILAVQRGLFVVGADLAANPQERHQLVDGISRVTADMVADLEDLIDEQVAAHPLRPVFVVPGSNAVSAHLDFARAVIRRAERCCVAAARAGHTVEQPVAVYLNRCSDLLYVLARAVAGPDEPASHVEGVQDV